MITRGGGRIINISSIGGLRPGGMEPGLLHQQGGPEHDDPGLAKRAADTTSW